MARISKEKKAEIRNNILTISRKRFVKDGYDNTSTSQIAKDVGIAEGTLFNYFKTKSDIFLEVMSEDYFDLYDENYMEYDLSSGVSEILLQFINKMVKKILVIPRKILVELGIALLGKVKSKPDFVKKMVSLDYKFIEQLTELIEDLQDKGLIKKCDTKALAELLYSILMFEMMIFLYEKDREKEDVMSNIEEKIKIVLMGYVHAKE